jgi:DNA polymerase-3 subunit gamma/tau
MAGSSLFHAALTEKYRPASWSEVVGQDKIVGRIRALLARRALAGRAYFISGASGTGKTTIARLIAAEIAVEWDIEEHDAGMLSVAKIADIERTLQYAGGIGRKEGDTRNGRAVIINEAHGLRKDVIRQLLVTLERIPAHVVWIFTTTTEGQEVLFEDCPDASPLLSRCLPLSLARRDLAQAFAERAKLIAEKEGLDGQPLEKYLRRVKERHNNLRAVLQDIEAGEMS